MCKLAQIAEDICECSYRDSTVGQMRVYLNEARKAQVPWQIVDCI